MSGTKNIKSREKGESYWPLRGSVYGPTDWIWSQQAKLSPNTSLQLEFV